MVSKQNHTRRFAYESKAKVPFSHSVGVGANGRTQGTICHKRVLSHCRRGIFRCAILCRCLHRAGLDGRQQRSLIPQFYPGEVIGDILIDGEETKGKELYDTALKVGTVFQNPRTQFYNVDTTGELAFGCENRGLPEKEIYTRIDKTVARFHMEKLMDRSIFHLSDGEKQKVACASVDVSDPDIILLDEPSANLDYDTTLVLREMMVQWKAAGKTIIVAEHRIAYLWDIIDRAVIMRDGRIVRELVGSEKDGLTPDELYSMGLRTTITESPSDIEKDTFRKEDTPITLKKFRFSYRGKKQPIVNIPLLQLAEGEITAIVGANGAGKTSLLNCLCGLEKRCKGKLQYKGKNYGRKARRKLCFMVMQDTGNQLFTESVLDEVLISLPKNTAHEKEKAREILQSLDLADYTDRHPQSLSGGAKAASCHRLCACVRTEDFAP